MLKIILSAAALTSLALVATSANARGGGPAQPWASPYALMEPQTAAPQMIAPRAADEGRAAFECENARCSPSDRERPGLLQREHAAPRGLE